MFTTRKAAITVMLGAMLVLPAAVAYADDPPGHPIQLEVGDSWTYGDPDKVMHSFSGVDGSVSPR